MRSDQVICIQTTDRASHAGIIGFQTRRGMGWTTTRAARLTARGLMRFFIDRHGTPAYLGVSSEQDMLTLRARTDDGLPTDELLHLPECLESLTYIPQTEYVAEYAPDREDALTYAV